MKKLLLSAFVALACAISANAQFGIVAGITSSATNYEDAAADIQNVSQYHVGVTYKLHLLGNLLAIQPSLLYDMKGTKIGEINKDTVGDAALDYKTGYLELPVQVQVGLGLGKLFRAYGFAEPFVGYQITSNIDKDWASAKDKLTYGLGVGVGAEVLRHLQVSVKYVWNLGNSLENESVDSVVDRITGSDANGVSASIAFLF